MAHVLHNNKVKFPKDIFFSFVLCTNMAVMTSSENQLHTLFCELFSALDSSEQSQQFHTALVCNES